MKRELFPPLFCSFAHVLLGRTAMHNMYKDQIAAIDQEIAAAHDAYIQTSAGQAGESGQGMSDCVQ